MKNEASMRAMRSIARDAGAERAKGGRSRARPTLTITIGEAEIEDDADRARDAGRYAASGDMSHRASTAEAAGAGATVGDLYEDEEDEED